MSCEDRRPLSQVPEDSVNTCMYPPCPTQDSFTLHAPYNPTDQNFFDAFAYHPSDVGAYLADPLPPDWANFQPTNSHDFDVAGIDLAYLSSMHHPEQLHAPFPFHTQFVPFFSNSDQAISQPFVDQSPENQAQPAEFDSFFADPNQASPEQFESFSAHPKQALPANFVPHFPDQNQAFFESLFPDTSATTLEPHQAPAADDLDAMLNFPDHFFTNANTEYREESDVSRPTAIAAFNAVVDPFEPATPPPARRPRPRKPKATPRTRTRPAARPSGFVPSDPDDLSSHEKKRLYVECLEHYVQYLHQLFAWIQVQPVPLERVSSYRSLTSRSLRTILIHLGKSSDILHGQIVHEEETLKGLQIRETLALMSQSYIAPDSPASDSTGTSSTYVSSNPDADIDDMAKFAYP